jgi:sulfur relay (sulfurtransferase) DsrF/TusC family protein
MEKVTIILNEGPSSMRTWNGLRVAEGSAGADMDVEVFLLDASVYAAKKGQNPPKELIWMLKYSCLMQVSMPLKRGKIRLKA